MSYAYPFEYILTAHFRLRKMDDEVYETLNRNLDEAALRNILGCRSEEEWAREKERLKQGYASYGHHVLFFHIMEPDSEQVIGMCGYHNWSYEHRRAELAYMLHEDKSKRRGIMTEVLSRVIAYGFGEMDLHRIEAMIAPDNVPSLRLIEKNGFTAEGMLREHYFTGGRHENSLVFSLLKKEYLLQQNQTAL